MTHRSTDLPFADPREIGHSACVASDPEQLARELRQISLMKQRVDEFRRGDLYLGRLIADLEGLLAACELADEQWIDDFQSAWGGLEISYAVALDRSTPVPDATVPTLSDDLHDLDKLIAAAMERLA
jgi:hypothetical protein